MTYDKEKMLKEGYEVDEKGEGEKKERKKKSKFIWSYIIKPIRKDYEDEK